MATQTVEIFAEQTGVTSTSDNFVVEPTAQVSVVGEVTSAGYAKLQYTIDSPAAISGATAVWVDASVGDYDADFGDVTLGPVTGVRLSVTSGTWNIKVLQVQDSDKQA